MATRAENWLNTFLSKGREKRGGGERGEKDGVGDESKVSPVACFLQQCLTS